MGYYTRHELEIVKGDISINELYSKWENKEFKFDGFEYYLDEDGECLGEGKWYSHEEDVRELSKLFPNILFKLSGKGEDSGDIWKEYYLNGRMQRCKAIITFEEYDEGKLI